MIEFNKQHAKEELPFFGQETLIRAEAKGPLTEKEYLDAVEKGERIKIELSVGDKVIYGKYSGTPYTVDGDEVIIIKASDILAKMA